MSRSSVYDRRMSRTMSLAFESAAVVPPDMAARARKMSLTLEAAMRPALDPRRLRREAATSGLEAAMESGARLIRGGCVGRLALAANRVGDPRLIRRG